MKKVLALAIAVLLLLALTPAAYAADTTVYVTVSVDGKLQIAAQPVSVSEPTVDAVLKAVHAKHYPGGESGYAAGIDATWNMFLISMAWGVPATPYVIINDGPLGSPGKPTTADTAPVQNGDNIVVSISSDPTVPAAAIALTVDVKGDSATITATSWVLDFASFSYSSSPLAGAAVVNPATGASLGVTDADGKATVPATGAAAIDGLSAVPVDGSSASVAPAGGPSSPSAPTAPSNPSAPSVPQVDYGLRNDRLLMRIMFGGIALIVPVFIIILVIGRKQEKIFASRAKKV